MRLYLNIMLNSIQSTTSYRFHTFISTLNRIISLFVQISLWTALYQGAKAFSITIPQATLHEMVIYTVFCALINLCVSNQNINAISYKIQTGSIEINIIRPIGLFRSELFETIGSKAFALLFEIIPIFLLALFIFHISLPSILTLIWFCISIVNGYLVYFLLTFVVGLCSFWYIRTFHLEFIVNHVINLLSGISIPLWFFPKTLMNISSYLPFDLIYFQPLSIVLQKSTGIEIGMILFKGFIWISVLSIIAVFTWKRAKNKLVIQGG